MSYDLDTFVNVTSKNSGRRVKYNEILAQTDQDRFVNLPARFEQHFDFDLRNESADPVFVYELAGKPVAWYDCELLVGCIVV